MRSNTGTCNLLVHLQASTTTHFITIEYRLKLHQKTIQIYEFYNELLSLNVNFWLKMRRRKNDKK